MTKRGESPTSILYAWIKAEIEADMEHDGAVDLKAITDRAATEFSQNRDVSHALFREGLRRLTLQIGQNVLANTRGFIAGDKLLTTAGLERKARELRGTWASWVEHVGGRYIRLPDMTRSDLLIAADERRTRSEHDGALAALWSALAAELKDGETVEQHFTDEQIEAVRARLIAPMQLAEVR